MKYNKTIPCPSCPFLKSGGIRLSKSRAKQIGSMMLSSAGSSFPCHQTTTEEERRAATRSNDFYPRDYHIHCAGALIFAEKNGSATQMMRICERIGMYDAEKLMSNKEVVASVFDNLRQMIAAQIPTRRMK